MHALERRQSPKECSGEMSTEIERKIAQREGRVVGAWGISVQPGAIVRLILVSRKE